MYYCTTHNLKCPYKLSPEAPLPCTANQDLCDKYVESQRLIREYYPNEPHYACHNHNNHNNHNNNGILPITPLTPCPHLLTKSNNLTYCNLPDNMNCDYQTSRILYHETHETHETPNINKIPINPILTLQLEET